MLLDVTPSKRLIYTNHAVKRLQERGITKEEVEYALEKGGITYPGKNPGVTVLIAELAEGRALKVVYKESKGSTKIVTVAWKGPES